MVYSHRQIEELSEKRSSVLSELSDLMLKTIVEGQPLSAESQVREHLLHGASRRLRTVHRTIERIFQIFPVNQTHPLDSESLSDVQTSLHAFMMNLYGLNDNWVWAFVHRHDLLKVIGDRRRVGLFHPATQRHLPTALREYLTSEELTKWHSEYAKSFRDALAHRIPPYVPPAEFTEDEGRKYSQLEAEKVECIKQMKWQRLDEVWAEQGALGRPSFVFLHAYTEDEKPRPVLLHPQLLSDGMGAVEFGRLFLRHWHEAA